MNYTKQEKGHLRWAQGGQKGVPPLEKRIYDPPKKSQDLLSKIPPMGPLTPLASMTVPTYDHGFHTIMIYLIDLR